MDGPAWSTGRTGDELRVQLYLGQQKEGKGEGFSIQQSIQRTRIMEHDLCFLFQLWLKVSNGIKATHSTTVEDSFP